MAVAATNIIRCACRMNYGGLAEIVNVLHFRVVTAVDTAEQDVADDLRVIISDNYANFAAFMPSALDTVSIDMYNVSQDYPMGQSQWGPSFTGGSASGDQLAPGNSLMVIWTTLVKRVQGKTYLGPFSEASTTGGNWNSAVLADINSFAGTMLSVQNGVNNTYRFGVWSRVQGQFFIPSGYRIPVVVSYQRRRREGRGS